MIIHQILHDQRSVPCFLIISVQSRTLKDRHKAETCTDYTISDTEEFLFILWIKSIAIHMLKWSEVYNFVGIRIVHDSHKDC